MRSPRRIGPFADPRMAGQRVGQVGDRQRADYGA